MPAVLEDLKLENPEKGYDQAMKDNYWFTKFSISCISTEALGILLESQKKEDRVLWLIF
ncbi:MAG: hypothetical protein SRB2_01632 [Desulfobacteraceae bacterium Eth-SRB2]|nr:MAG: hypothetical protein SRB2_01632 [Desulfobacteraceae bacterium Eth-SRB2]